MIRLGSCAATLGATAAVRSAAPSSIDVSRREGRMGCTSGRRWSSGEGVIISRAMDPAVPVPLPDFPVRPPFVLRARLLTPLDDGRDAIRIGRCAGGERRRPDRRGRSMARRVGRRLAGVRPPAPGAAAGHGRPARPPAAGARRGRRCRAGPADLAGAPHLQPGARVPGAGGRGAGAGHLPCHGRVRHDHDPGLRRHLGRQPRRGLPGRGGTRHPGHAGSRDDGSAQLRR